MVSKDLTFNLFGRDINATASLRKVAASAEESSRTMKRSFGELPKIAAEASAGAVAGSVYLAAGFQSASLRLVTDAGESAKSLNKVKQGMLDIASQTGLTAGEVNAGMYLIESAGYHGAAGLKVMSAAAQGAKIGGGDVKTIADALTTAMTDYHIPASKAAETTSKLIATVGQGKTTMEDLAGSLHNVLPNAAALHLSFAQVTGAMATMTGEGISADQASQNLNHALVSLANPTQVQTKEMAAMGLNSTTVASQLGKKGLTGTLDTLVTAITSHMGKGGLVLQNAFNQSKLAAQSANAMFKQLPSSVQSVATAYQKGTITQKDWTTAVKGMTPANANLAKQWAASQNEAHGFSAALKSNQGAAQTFTGALSKMTGGQVGLGVALHLTGDHMGAFENNVKIIGKASTETGGKVKGWAETQTNFNQQLAQARSTIETVAIQLGTNLLPAFTSGVKVFGGFFGALKDGNVAARIFAGVLGGVVAALTAVFVAQKLYAAGAMIVQGVMGVVRLATAAWTGVQWLLNSALLANPITFIVVAIVGLIVIIVLLVTHWKQVCKFLQDVWGGVCKWFADTLRSIGAIWATVWGAVAGFLHVVWAKVSSFLATWGPLILAILLPVIGIPLLIAQHWNQIAAFMRKLWAGIASFLRGAMNGIATFFKNAWNGIVSWFRSSANAYLNFWRGVWTNVVNFFRTAIDRAVAVARALPGKIMGFFKGAATWLLNAGKWVLQGFINGIQSMFGSVWSVVANIAGGVITVFKNLLGIHSPSRVFHEHGQNIVQGLINGITGNTAGVHAAVAGLVPGMAGGTLGVNVASAAVRAAGGTPASANRAGGITVNVTVQGAMVGTSAQLGQVIYAAVKQGVRQGGVPKNAFTTL